MREFTFSIQIKSMGSDYSNILMSDTGLTSSEAKRKVKLRLLCDFAKSHNVPYKFSIGEIKMI